jgi:peptidoglycan/xylan/chitin deacetylase (PgdA/CDA1 family)
MVREKRVVSLSGVLLFFFHVGFIGAGIGKAQTRWVGSWATSQQLPEPNNSLSAEDVQNATLRQIVHLSIGGAELRVHLSNGFGTTPLHFTSVHIARPVSMASPKILPETDKALTFSGRQDVTIPAGAEYISDPISFSVAPLSDLAITLYIEQAPTRQTGHPGSRANSYLAHGNLVSAAELPDAKKVEHWYFVAGVDVAAPASAASIVILGDSITDGHGATTDGNDRWPDLLAKRLQAAPGMQALGILNHGIGGNRLLLDGLGPNALARFDHDVLAQAGVRYLIVLEGINDLGMLTHDHEVPQAEHDAMVQHVIAAYEQIVTRAHAHGVSVIGATVMPFAGSTFYHPDSSNEADRQAVNQWIRTPSHFDAVVDFDKVTRDPEHPDRFLPAYDCGDHLHPSPTGFAAMAESIPLSLFSGSAQWAGPGPKIAFTFDDLPAHNALPPGETRLDVANKIIAALREAQLPHVFGFVNGSRTEEHPEERAVLQAWHDAGYPLGNHTWTHMNLNQYTLEEFEKDAGQNEPLLNSLMKKEDWHWFRYPFLAEGDTPTKKAGFRSFLQQHGYKVAAVTMSFGDYQWNEPYARCKTKGDNEAIAGLENSYLTAAEESINYSRWLSHTLYGRDIPYVLLMHVGAFDAEMLPRLLNLYRSKGFQFVTLADAEADQFYRVDTDLKLPLGVETLEEAMRERNLPLPPHAVPVPQFDSVCR